MNANNKKPSGAYWRKQKSLAKVEEAKNSATIRTWLIKSDTENSANTRSVTQRQDTTENNDNVALEEGASASTSDINNIFPRAHDNPLLLHSDENSVQDKIFDDDNKDEVSSDDGIYTNRDFEQEQTNHGEFDFGDPATWPDISDSVRVLLVEHGPVQNENITSVPSTSETSSRRFTAEWFMKTLPNKQRIRRNRPLYSVSKSAVYCFPCILFGTSKSALGDVSKGFNDWRHLHPRIPDHENSQDHRSNYLAWKQLEKRLREGQCIDAHLEDAINSEKAKWRHILKAILHAILFCAANNLALRGSDDQLGSQSKAGIFLNLIELLCKFDDLLPQHVEHLKTRSLSYLSPTIRNKFIELLASRVRDQIISKMKRAKYYAILFDGTPDTSRQEQLSQVIRYVEVSKKQCIVQENFIDFVNTKEKTGEGLASDIIKKLETDGIDINDMRGQGYDNGANMAGKYNGVQAHISRRNSLAAFIPCSVHSLNLAGLHAASVTVNMVSFFGTVQSLYCFLSSSTSRWETLMRSLKVTLKGHSETRWSWKARAVSSLKNQLPTVVDALKKITADIKQADAVSVANSLLKQIQSYDFVATLVFWNVILGSIDKVTIALQKKGLIIDQAIHMLSGLKKTVMDWREDENFKLLFEEIDELADSMGIEKKFAEPRKRKVRRLELYESEDQGHIRLPSDTFKFMCYEVIDSICAQLESRYNSLSTILADFQFLFGPSLKFLSKAELRKHAADFALKYANDVDGYELAVEVESFKFQAAEIVPDLESASPLDLLTILHKMELCESYPNIEIALRIFLTLPVTTASCERSFSKLKLIKNYLRSSMGQERLSGLAILSIEHELDKSIDFDDIIDKFAALKARKVKF